jgi:hypothetical protein
MVFPFRRYLVWVESSGETPAVDEEPKRRIAVTFAL